MSLITYDETAPWARSMRDKVLNGTMPPWHADAERGRFANDRRMSDAERDVIVKWVTAGAPKGERQRPAAGADLRRRVEHRHT